ncbi:hypothetical protein [Borrelia duttonii]|uniref:Arthropod-associated lipoprotein n=1 Tax=Borrelia duttonii (strain Ly) TaxID=412419 RepID=B5RNG7_BORDL|nr:hypothetical protein BDU_1112 [Borrelia duttonii Ly]
MYFLVKNDNMNYKITLPSKSVKGECLMKKIILSAFVALFTFISCGDKKVDPSKYGTGTGTNYVKFIQDPDKVVALAKNFNDIKDALPKETTGKPYKEANLTAAFTAISTHETKFLKALALEKARKSAKENENANSTEIDKEFETYLTENLKFAKGGETVDGSYASIMKKFTDELVK